MERCRAATVRERFLPRESEFRDRNWLSCWRFANSVARIPAKADGSPLTASAQKSGRKARFTG